MKKEYIEPIAKIITLDVENMIATSDEGDTHPEIGDIEDYSNRRESSIWDNEL